ncbi:MAG: homospermidine synthase [Candidatus Saganbacteria bacterium]|uniref:Homospermidine synthase n=1 Tax=Candidatus Saganbacteria bacterium TaxID=2575572 RepID=A0A833NWE3_UNCSA|nr:MAG: homospermidine synthase [Candidatus Saganbacteria bacterium]
MEKIKFKGKILVIGCGFVSRCTLPLLLKHLDMPAQNITIMDFEDFKDKIKDTLSMGVKYVIDRITPDNMPSKLKEFVSSGDMIIDLAWNIECTDILNWCHDNNVLYINTSVELWDPYEGAEDKPPTERTLYVRHLAIREMVSKWQNKKGSTAVVEHGANPGLVSHFTKVALIDIANKIINEKPKDKRIPELKEAIKAGNFPKLAQLTGVKVIHISERDTQITNKPKEVNEFVNTWSIEGFREEGVAPAEMGWGTHERKLPMGAHFHKYGPGNQICLSQMGIKTWVRSWVPCGEITGMVVRHGEAFTISDYLTVWGKDAPVYRPTVHYAYCPADCAINSLHELEMRWFDLQKKQRVLTDEIISGKDELGVLLMGHDFDSWWTGSLLDIEESRKLVPHQNATTLQVACSVLAAVIWMVENPDQGVCVPDNLPYQRIMEIAKPYLGPFVSQAVDWTPLKTRVDLQGDPWQFESFLIK